MHYIIYVFGFPLSNSSSIRFERALKGKRAEGRTRREKIKFGGDNHKISMQMKELPRKL